MSGAAWAGGANPLGLTDLEVASGVVRNTARRWPALPVVAADPLGTLGQLLLPLLQHPPLVVAFSGGRDSSALLAAAVDVARRDGLQAPVAATMRWEGDVASDESEWQETVVRSLGVTDWERLHPGEDLDLVGTLAADTLRDHGLLWPAPVFALRPLLRAARGGTLVSGEGGDEVFGRWPLAAARSAVRARRPSRRHARQLAARLAPYQVRYRATARAVHAYQTWLEPPTLDAQRAALAGEHAVLPAAWPTYLAQQAASRDLELTVRSLERLGAAEGAAYRAPFLDDRFVGALGALGGRFGIGDRGDVMLAVFGRLLPGTVLTRSTKASFGNVFWGPGSRDFADAWSGRGLEGLVRADDLRASWRLRPPPYGAALPLHAAWLADHGPATAP